MSLKLIVVELCLPVVVCLGLVLAVPHIIAKSIVPALGTISSAHRLIHFSTCLCTVMFIMAALCNRGAIIFCPVVSIFLLLLSFFSSPNLSRRRLDVYRTSTNGVALV